MKMNREQASKALSFAMKRQKSISVSKLQRIFQALNISYTGEDRNEINFLKNKVSTLKKDLNRQKRNNRKLKKQMEGMK